MTRLTMRDALMRLGPRQRAVLVDVGVGTVRSQTARALARLRETASEFTRQGASEEAGR